MIYIDWRKVLDSFASIVDEDLINNDAIACDATVTLSNDVVMRVFAFELDRVGRELFKKITLERIIAPAAFCRSSANSYNAQSVCVANLIEDGELLRFQISSDNIRIEDDVPNLARRFLNIGIENDCANTDLEKLRKMLNKRFHEVDNSCTYISEIPDYHDAAFFSLDSDVGYFFVNLVVSDNYAEGISVHDNCAHLNNVDFFDPQYCSTAERDVQAARLHGKTQQFKLTLAAEWNFQYSQKYWRLRACVVGDRLVFKMPIIEISGNEDFTREFESLEAVISNQFHSRNRIFAPIGLPNYLWKATFDTAKKVIFGS